MSGLLSALYRRRSSANGVCWHDGFADEDKERGTFSLSGIPTEDRVVEGLTLSNEVAEDGEHLALLCRLCHLRFGSVDELQCEAVSSADEPWFFAI